MLYGMVLELLPKITLIFRKTNTMILDTVSAVWEALLPHIDLNERKYAATSLVDFLIDNDYQPDEILEHFQGNTELTTALKGWTDQYGDDNDPYDDSYDEDEDDDNW